MENGEITSQTAPAVQLSEKNHRKLLKDAVKQVEVAILPAVPRLLNTLLAHALPHETMYLREYNDAGEFQFERRIIDPTEIEHIKRTHDQKLYRIEFYPGNADISERLLDRALGKPKVAIDITTDGDKINPEQKRTTDSVLDQFLATKEGKNIKK